ncbi:MAG: hypothetical protein JWQ90_1800 [Hydrocarboniphaga sp.]|uniref:hypothetical protein n=1 Tax=Hydrocarboniphaga sp. TaxID=2033016 RepID=UPI0026026A73|nr:hypothetical protein [Hydrocarboniphaga sp.]MDB5969350.1 hypothetical protein [Hydrocarboniphaga sp.]
MPANPQTDEGPVTNKTLLRYRTADSFMGVTRKTALAVARQLGVSETQLIHQALAEFVGRVVPQYETPDDEISGAQWAALDTVSAKTEHGESLGKLF